MKSLYERSGIILMRETLFEEAFQYFLKGNVDAAVILSLFPKDFDFSLPSELGTAIDNYYSGNEPSISSLKSQSLSLLKSFLKKGNENNEVASDALLMLNVLDGSMESLDGLNCSLKSEDFLIKKQVFSA